MAASRNGLAELSIRAPSSTERASPRTVSAACSSASRPPRSDTFISRTGTDSAVPTRARGLSLALSAASRSVSSTRSISSRSDLA